MKKPKTLSEIKKEVLREKARILREERQQAIRDFKRYVTIGKFSTP